MSNDFNDYEMEGIFDTKNEEGSEKLFLYVFIKSVIDKLNDS